MNNIGGAAVYINNVFVGNIQNGSGELFVPELIPGTHTLRVVAPGFSTVERPFDVHAGVTNRVSLTQTRTQSYGEVRFDNLPRGTQVFVDGTLVGTAPLDAVRLATGTHQARFSLFGFLDLTLDFNVSPDGVQAVPVNLVSTPQEREANYGNLQLRDYPGANVYGLEREEDEVKVRFDTSAAMGTVYEHFHAQLVQQGWRRGDFEMKPNRAEAEYRHGDRELEFKLQREGNSGGYRLEVEWDG